MRHLRRITLVVVRNLYFCFRCFSPRPVSGGQGQYYQFGFNPAGAKFDGEAENAGWEAATPPSVR